MTRRLTGSAITRTRDWWRPKIAAGVVLCWRCSEKITPDQPWDLGHLHDLALGGDPRGRMVPEHRSCNRSAGATLGNALRRRPRRRLTEWLEP